MGVQIKRVYDSAEAADGTRVLVDRLWPRGLSKSNAALDLWLKDVGPSSELRQSWHADPDGHDPEHFAVFSEKYRAELREPPASGAFDELAMLARDEPRLTLLYGARDERFNHAVVLLQQLRERIGAANDE